MAISTPPLKMLLAPSNKRSKLKPLDKNLILLPFLKPHLSAFSESTASLTVREMDVGRSIQHRASCIKVCHLTHVRNVDGSIPLSIGNAGTTLAPSASHHPSRPRQSAAPLISVVSRASRSAKRYIVRNISLWNRTRASSSRVFWLSILTLRLVIRLWHRWIFLSGGLLLLPVFLLTVNR